MGDMMAATVSAVFLTIVFICFLFAWSYTHANAYALTPFLVFAAHEILWAWPITVVAPHIGLAGIYPAILIGLSFVCFLLGYLITHSKLKLGGKLAAFVRRPVERQMPEAAYRTSLIVFCILLTCTGLYLYQGMPPIVESLDALWSGEAHSDVVASLSDHRRELTKGYYFGGEYRGQGAIQTVQAVGWPYVVFLTLMLSLKTKKLRWMLASVALLPTAIVFLGAVGVRTEIVKLFVAILVGVSFLRQWTKIHILGAGVVLCSIVLMVVPFSGQMVGELDSDDVLGTLAMNAVDRVLVGDGIHNIEVFLHIQHGRLDFGAGRLHIEKAINSLPGVTYGTPFSYTVHVLRNGVSETTFASPTYFGFLYADFGPIGVLATYMVIGAYCAVLEGQFLRGPKGMLRLAAMTGVFHLTSLLSVGTSVGMIPSLIVLAAFHWSFLTLTRFMSRQAEHARSVRNRISPIGQSLGRNVWRPNGPRTSGPKQRGHSAS